MWELYGLWSWFLALYTDYLDEEDMAGLGGSGEDERKRLASLLAFATVGASSVSCVFVGWIGEIGCFLRVFGVVIMERRERGRHIIEIRTMCYSGSVGGYLDIVIRYIRSVSPQ